MLWSRLKKDLKLRAFVLLDGLEISALLLGSGVSVVFGKFLAAVIFAGLAIGIASRMLRRRAETSVREVLPFWASLVSGVLAIVGAAVVVESVNLPIKFDQLGFEKSNWLVVVALLLFFYGILRTLFVRFFSRSTRNNAIAQSK